MKHYHICICDDEEATRQKLKRDILQYSFTYDVNFDVTELDSDEQLFALPDIYDILFLDIRFGDRNSGIDATETLRRRGNRSVIILITSLKGMAIDGYRAEPLRFLVKPVSQKQVFDTLTVCLKKLNNTVSYLQITSNFSVETIRTDQILYICSKLRKRNVVCLNDKVLETWQTLNELMENLPSNAFAFAGKSYIVNLNAVQSVKNNVILLSDGTSIPLGSHFKDSFMKTLFSNVYH